MATRARRVLELTGKSATFRFRNIGSRPVLSLNRGFSAPVRLNANLSNRELLFLIAHDSDSFNRWEAAQTIGRQLIIQCMQRIAAGRPAAAPTAFAEALRQALREPSLDTQFLSLMLTLPGEQDIAGEVARNIDPQLVHDATRNDPTQARPDPFAGPRRRAGKSVARAPATGRMSKASADGRCAMPPWRSWPRPTPAPAPAWPSAHFNNALNMTEKIAALTVLIEHAEPEREEASGELLRPAPHRSPAGRQVVRAPGPDPRGRHR